MAEPVYLFLKVNGNAVKGDSTQSSLDRKDSIECLSFDEGAEGARESGDWSRHRAATLRAASIHNTHRQGHTPDSQGDDPKPGVRGHF